MESQFVQEMHLFISKHTMIEDGEIVLVAVSGGADSLALLYGLHSLHTLLNCHLHVVHLNHGLRQDATADANFVHEHSTRLGLPFTGHTVELPELIKQWKLSVEAAGRQARYEFYESVSSQVGATKVALGHHKDDIAETVLMNLIRGSGSNGLKGIKPIRDGKYIRPLAHFTRNEIENYLKSIGVVPRQDETNQDTRFLRNRIRHELIPLLEQNYNTNIRTGLCRTAEILSSESDYLDKIAHDAFNECKLSSTQSDRIIIDRGSFLQYNIVLQRRILRNCISEIIGQVSDFSFEHCSAILKNIHGDKPNTVVTLPNGLQFKRAYQQLIFEKEPVKTADFQYELIVPGNTYLKELDVEIEAIMYDITQEGLSPIPDGTFDAFFDYDTIQLPLTVRNRKSGDRFHPYGMKGTKKIKDLLMDAKIPRCERDRIPLVLSGNEIVWVIGFTTNERYKVLSKTQTILHLTYGNDENYT